jgi:hypothetical protein
MTTQYARGAAFERRVMVDLEELGYYVVRSAGSHSVIDVVALAYQVTLGVQVKLDGRCDPDEWNDLWALASTDKVDHALIASTGPKRGQIVYRRLTGPKSGTRGERAPSEVWEP